MNPSPNLLLPKNYDPKADDEKLEADLSCIFSIPDDEDFMILCHIAQNYNKAYSLLKFPTSLHVGNRDKPLSVSLCNVPLCLNHEGNDGNLQSLFPFLGYPSIRSAAFKVMVSNGWELGASPVRGNRYFRISPEFPNKTISFNG